MKVFSLPLNSPLNSPPAKLRKCIAIKVKWILVTTTAFIPTEAAFKMNLLLYRIPNEQIDM